MKIVANSKQANIICYLQVKDFLKLARIYNDKKFIQCYIQLLNEGKGDNEFVNVSNMQFVDKIIVCDAIANLNEFLNMSIEGITRHLIQLYSFDLNNGNNDDQSDDLRDIISFKKGELEYPIPMQPNSNLCSENGFNLYSSIIKGFYIISGFDSAIDNSGKDDFLKKALEVIAQEEGYCSDDSILDYKLFKKGDSLIIIVNNAIRKKGIIGRILGKIKRS